MVVIFFCVAFAGLEDDEENKDTEMSAEMTMRSDETPLLVLTLTVNIQFIGERKVIIEVIIIV